MILGETTALYEEIETSGILEDENFHRFFSDTMTLLAWCQLEPMPGLTLEGYRLLIAMAMGAAWGMRHESSGSLNDLFRGDLMDEEAMDL